MIQVITLFVLVKDLQCQTEKEFEQMLCRAWKLQLYQRDGQIIMPAEDQKEDRMIFYSNRTLSSVESGIEQDGFWQFDEEYHTLTVGESGTLQFLQFNVIEISNQRLVLEFANQDGPALSMTMVPAEKD